MLDVAESSHGDGDIFPKIFKMIDNLYKCNICEKSFSENFYLLTHLKSQHWSNVTKALRPQFSCGVCPAKFFKNSFLIKHCEHHLKEK